MWIIAAVLIAFALNLAAVSFRLGLLLKYFDFNVPYSIVFKTSAQGHFSSLFFTSLIGQVVGRQVILKNYGASPVLIASLTAIERLVLFAVSGVFFLLGVVWLLGRKEVSGFLGDISFTQIVLVVILSLLASLWFGRSRFEVRLLTKIRFNKSISLFFGAVGITFIAQALVLGAFLLGAMGLTSGISFWSLLAAAAITSFVASLPISVNGWGVREIAAISSFGYVGMEQSSALAVSILVGLCSTAVVLVAFYGTLHRKHREAVQSLSGDEKARHLVIEKKAAWGLITATAVLIFFQIHFPLYGGVVNLNLADGFAILALTTVATLSLYTRKLPRWLIPKFNLLLLGVSILLLFAFLNGIQTIGITQWALVSRLLGWLILLGYLCIGILTISYLGRVGVWRFIETMIATVVVIVLFHILMRWLVSSGWIDSSNVTVNFEGFSGNRNAFAFQLLTCSVLLLAYTRDHIKGSSQFNVRNDFLLAAVFGVILAGLAFAGSRAGILSGLILIAISTFTGFANRRLVFRGVIYAFILWVIFVWFLPWVSQVTGNMSAQNMPVQIAVQSSLSNVNSSLERLESIRRGFEMWRDSPWLGAGLGVFVETSQQWSKHPIVIHSTPVWMLAEFGLLGAGILIAMLIRILIAIMRNDLDKPGNRAVIMLLAVFVTFSLVHEIFYQRIFWLALGLCLALPFHDRSPPTSRYNLR